MTFREIFLSELSAHQIRWCPGPCKSTQSHARGFACTAELPVVHLASSFATRSSLHRGLHEIAHCILDENGLRRFEKEGQANRWAETKMRELGVPVPRKTASAGRSYVSRMKRWGDNIRRAGR